jgi:hypothetical protein
MSHQVGVETQNFLLYFHVSLIASSSADLRPCSYTRAHLVNLFFY